MSKTDLRNEASTNHGSRQSNGHSLYNQNPAQRLYDQEFNSITENDRFNDIAAGLGDVERAGNKIINDNADTKQKAKSPAESFKTNFGANKNQSAIPSKRKLITKAAFKGKSSLITVLIVLFGGGGALTLFMSPALVISQATEVLKTDLNDQVHAFDKRQSTLLRAKLKSTTNGACGLIKINCRFATMTNAEVERFRAAGIAVDRDMSKGFGGKRGQITRMVHTNSDTGVKTSITSAEDLTRLSQSDINFRAALTKGGLNATFAGLTDKVSNLVLKRDKATKTPQATGDTDDERQKNLNKVVATGEELDTNTIRPQTDENNKPTGQYVDEDGNLIDKNEQAQAAQTADIGEAATKIGSKNLLGSFNKVLGGAGYVDNMCTFYNSSRALATLAKVKKKAQAIRFFTMGLASVSDSIKAGDGNQDTVSTTGAMMTQADTRDKIVDEKKWNDSGTASNIPTIDNPDKGKSAMDSPAMKMVQYGDVPVLDSRANRFVLGWGLVGTLSNINTLIARVVNGGNPDPRQVSAKCKLVQNPFVRIGSLGVGILAGVGSFGLSTALGITGSLAIGFALPYILSSAADLMAGKTFQDLSGMDFGDAAFVGASGYFGDIAQNSGMKPLSAQEAVAYTTENKQTNDKYADVEKYMARATPFDINNQFSFLGSLSRSIAPVARQSATSVSSTVFSLASLVPTSLSFGTQTAKADDTIARFQQCKDPVLNQLGIGADVFCNVRYGLSEQELAMDPLENAQWMADTGNIDPESETGDVKDNEQAWNYAKFMKECVNRTAGLGEYEDENQSDGSGCVDPANEAANHHFRIYTFDLRVNDALDSEDEGSQDPGTTGVTDGTKGTVDTDGWAYPTTRDAKITSGYKTTQRPDHRGVDLAQAQALNKPIYAARGGTVIMAGLASGYGNWIVIKHDNGAYSIYGHMFNDGVLVRRGDTVTAGQQIGKIGWNGDVSPKDVTGSHLHFEIWDSSPLNPSCTRNGRPETIDCSIDPTPIVNNAQKSQVNPAVGPR